MSKPWGAIGAWADDVESEMAAGPPVHAPLSMSESHGFPPLKDAVATKPSKKKKQVMTLGEFQSGAVSRAESRGLTHEEMRALPSGPRDRSGDEDYGRLGGGFRSYGGGRRTEGGGWGRERGDETDGSRGTGGRSYGGFSDERRPPSSMDSDFVQRSRADEADDWSTMKKSMGPPPDSGRGQGRYSSLDTGNNSKADDVDNWNTGKKVFPARSVGDFDSNFREVRPDSGRRRIVLDPPRRESASIEPQRSRPSPFGAARPREEVLAEKGLDWRRMDSEVDGRKSSRPSSAQSSQPGSPGDEPELVPKQKINPFGDAKPREMLLEEKGKDWRKIDFELEHRAVDRPETMEEKLLRDEIHQLKKKLSDEPQVKLNGQTDEKTAELPPSLKDLVVKKEKDLELLIRELDDKVRFGQKGTERPSSGTSRTGSGHLERAPSQSSLSEDSRNIEIGDRPRSRGVAPDIWTRTDDDRRGFRERGFLGNRNTDRFRSNERW